MLSECAGASPKLCSSSKKKIQVCMSETCATSNTVPHVLQGSKVQLLQSETPSMPSKVLSLEKSNSMLRDKGHQPQQLCQWLCTASACPEVFLSELWTQPHNQSSGSGVFSGASHRLAFRNPSGFDLAYKLALLNLVFPRLQWEIEFDWV